MLTHLGIEIVLLQKGRQREVERDPKGGMSQHPMSTIQGLSQSQALCHALHSVWFNCPLETFK